MAQAPKGGVLAKITEQEGGAVFIAETRLTSHRAPFKGPMFVLADAGSVRI